MNTTIISFVIFLILWLFSWLINTRLKKSLSQDEQSQFKRVTTIPVPLKRTLQIIILGILAHILLFDDSPFNKLFELPISTLVYIVIFAFVLNILNRYRKMRQYNWPENFISKYIIFCILFGIANIVLFTIYIV